MQKHRPMIDDKKFLRGGIYCDEKKKKKIPRTRVSGGLQDEASGNEIWKPGQGCQGCAVPQAEGGLTGGTVTCKKKHAAPRASQLQPFDVAT